MTMFWSRDNDPIADTLEWARLFEDDLYRIVAYDIEGSHAVSTIWLGIDQAHQLHVTDDTAMIFETAFLIDDVVVDSVHWHTEAGALSGHSMMCVKLLGRPARPMDGHRERFAAERREKYPPRRQG
jgi:hypothetical protein